MGAVTAVLASLLLLSPVAGAQESGAPPPELVTDRPDQTESSTVVPPGFAQLETGWLFTRDEEGALAIETHELPGSLLRVGLAERLELRVGWGGWVREETETPAGGTSTDGVADGDLGIKWLLAEGTATRPQLAVIAGSTVPVGSRALTSDRFDPFVRLTSAHELTPEVSLAWNLGAEWASTPAPVGGTDTDSTLVYTVAAGFPVGARTGAFVELFGGEPLEGDGRHEASFDGGLTWLLAPALQLDLAAGAGLTDAAPDWFVGLGVSARWPR